MSLPSEVRFIQGEPSINAFIQSVQRFFNFMAKMGLSVRDDPRKVVDVTGRTWGQAVDGLALSVLLKVKEDSEELPTVSVAIHNQSEAPARLNTRGWLHHFEVVVVGQDGTVVPQSPYGRELFRAERRPPVSEVVLAPGEAVEADIPIGSIFQMRKGQYRVHASCEVTGGARITSSQIQVSY